MLFFLGCERNKKSKIVGCWCVRTDFSSSFMCLKTQFWNRLCLLGNYGLTIVHMCWKMWAGNNLHLLEKNRLFMLFFLGCDRKKNSRFAG